MGRRTGSNPVAASRPSLFPPVERCSGNGSVLRRLSVCSRDSSRGVDLDCTRVAVKTNPGSTDLRQITFKYLEL